jgi:hypothetical protein
VTNKYLKMKTPPTFLKLAGTFILLLGMLQPDDTAAQTYTVTLDKQGESGGTDQVTVVAGKPMPVALSPLKEGYAFNGYFDAVSDGKQYYTPAMASASDWDKTADATLYAQWITLPAAFSWGNHLGQNWLSTPKNQGACGSCWAFSMAASYEARKRIVEIKPALAIDLSEQHMVSCWAGNCNGGGTATHWNKFRDEGVPDEACFPYVASAVPCSSGCSDWTSRVFRAAAWASNSIAVAEIKREIMVNGPVYAIMDVYQDFYSYSMGIYSHLEGDFAGSKAVIIYGWDNADDCWLVVNTWGTNWGETGPGGTKGFFRVSISANNCNFPRSVINVRPVRDYILHYPGELEIGRESGATGEFMLATETDWTVSDDASWLSLSTSGATGNAVVTATATEENTSALPRTATVTVRAKRIDDITITITQQGVSTDIPSTRADLLNSVRVYPNPFTNLINLENVAGIERVVITNINGQVLDIAEPKGSGSLSIPATRYQPGTYLVNISLPTGEKKVLRIIKTDEPQ